MQGKKGEGERKSGTQGGCRGGERKEKPKQEMSWQNNVNESLPECGGVVLEEALEQVP